MEIIDIGSNIQFGLEFKSDPTGEFIILTDMSHRGSKSVTNAAEGIVEWLRMVHGRKLLESLVIYKDSMDIYDGIKVVDGEFRGFVPLGQQHEPYARGKMAIWALNSRNNSPGAQG